MTSFFAKNSHVQVRGSWLTICEVRVPDLYGDLLVKVCSPNLRLKVQLELTELWFGMVKLWLSPKKWLYWLGRGLSLVEVWLGCG